MKNIIRTLSMAVFALFLVSCSPSMRVSTDFDRHADFSGFRTFGIFDMPDEDRNISPLHRNRILNAIRAALIEKGYTESTTPDFWVNPVVIIQHGESHSSTTTGFAGGMGMGWGMGGFHRPYGWGGGMMMGGPMIAHTQHHVHRYINGSLIIDIINARSHNLVWTGTGEREINRNFKRNAETKINDYVRRILAGFPPDMIVHSTTRVTDMDINYR